MYVCNHCALLCVLFIVNEDNWNKFEYTNSKIIYIYMKQFINLCENS